MSIRTEHGRTMSGQGNAVPVFDVSVVVPLYDKAAYVGRAVASVLAQKLVPREILVIDDGSRDDGPEIVAALAARHPAVRLVSQLNAGPSAARNRGIAEAAGDWIAFLDADDAWLPHHLAGLARLADRFPAAGLLAAGYREVRESQHDGEAEALAQSAAEPVVVGEFYKRWRRSAFVSSSSVAVRRRDLLALGTMFPPGERLGEDLDVWFRLAERTPVAYLPVVGALYTVGLAQSLTGSLAVTEPLPCYRRLSERIDRPEFPRDQRRAARALLATHWLNVARAKALSGDRDGARRLLADPIARRRPVYWLRTLLVVAANSGPWRPLHLGRI